MTSFFKIILTALCLLLFISCATNSTLTIDGRQEFVLGETNNSDFKVTANNVSDKQLRIVLVDKTSNQAIKEILLEADETAIVKAAKGQKLLVKNNGRQKAKVNVKLNKDVQGMRFQSLIQTPVRILQKDSLLIELNILEEALTSMHPGLYRYNSPKQIEDIFDSIRSELPQEIEESEYMIRLAQIIQKIKCGHTYLNPWNLDSEVRNRLFGGKTYLPLGLEVIDGRFYITENASQKDIIKRGAELLSVNGVGMYLIYQQLKTVAKIDGNNTVAIDHYLSVWDYKTSNWHAFDIYLQLFHPLRDEFYTIEYQNYKNNKVGVAQLKAMSKNERANNMSNKYGNQILEREDWKLDIVSTDLAIMKIGTFATWNFKNFDYQQWLANAFKKLDSLKIKKLAIDIRGNGGGLTEPANELISYLIDKPIACREDEKVLIRTVKFAPELLPYINTGAKILESGLPEELYRDDSDGLYQLMLPSDCSEIKPSKYRFKGERFIFGGPSNVSATYTLLDKANTYGFATFIGQESGGNLQGINGGEYAFFKLPYSKMEVDIPLKYFKPAISRPDSGVKPSVRIKKSQAEIEQNTDSFLEYLKQ
ncbi:S41 family peptidase [Polaribacter sp.]|uniref:S41 family peptidase n=1 Tax=Polaribacter sp. TaxID=1920175 RepID=UPI003F694FFA